MNVFELVAKLTLDSSEYEAALKKAKTGAEQDKIRKGFATTAAAGAAALGALAVSSVKTGAEFDKAMSQVAATMGKSMAEVNNEVGSTETSFGHFEGTLREFAQYMGANTAFSATQAAEALNYMALAGYDAQKSMNMLPTVLNLAAAGDMELARASDMVTDAQSALGLDTQQTTEMVDKMAQTAAKSNTSVAQLGEAFLTIGATARNLAGGTTELSTVLGVLADNGIKSAEGGTHLRNMLLSLQGLQNPTKDQAAALKELNMSIEDIYDESGNMRSLPEIFQKIGKSMGGMTQQSKDAIISGLFNKTDLAAVNALLGTEKKRFDELAEAIDGSAGAADKMAHTQLDNLAGDVTLLKSAWEGLQIEISDKLAPTLRKVVQFVTDLITHFEEIAPVVEGAAVAFGIFAVAINIKKIVSSVTTAFTAFNAVLAANPIGLIIALVAGLVVALVGLWNNNEEFRNKVTAAWEAIKEAWNSMVEKIKAAGQELKQDWENIKQSASQLKEAVAQAWENIKQAVSNVVQGAVQWGSQLISNIVNGIRGMFGNLQSAAQGIGDSIRNGIQNIISQAASWGRDLINNFIGGIKSMAGGLANAASSAASTVKSFLHFSEPDKGPLADFHTYAPDMMRLFAKGITDNTGLIEDAFNDSLDISRPTIETAHMSYSGANFGQNVRELVLNITETIDGSVLARNQFKYNLDEADRHGGNLINAYA